MEQWKAIPGFENIYEVSSFGNVRSVDRINPAGRREKAQPLTPQVSRRGGYLVINLRKNLKTFSKKVHHLVAFAFLGDPPLPISPGHGTTDGYCEVNHKNGKRQDNRVENLEYCTRLENIRHSYRIGLRDGKSKGERNGRAKLTYQQVREIRERYATGTTSIPKLAALFGIGKSTIGYIVQGVTWKHD
jgi:hypothetical protein